MSISLARSHQTVVFVRVASDASPKYRERAARFVESLNRYGSGSTIKADVYSVSPEGRITEGLVFDVPSYLPVNVVGSPQLRDAATAAGYAQSVILAPTDDKVADYGDESAAASQEAARAYTEDGTYTEDGHRVGPEDECPICNPDLDYDDAFVKDDDPALNVMAPVPSPVSFGGLTIYADTVNVYNP